MYSKKLIVFYQLKVIVRLIVKYISCIYLGKFKKLDFLILFKKLWKSLKMTSMVTKNIFKYLNQLLTDIFEYLLTVALLARLLVSH